MKISLQQLDQMGENKRKNREDKFILTLSIICSTIVALLGAYING